MNKYYSTYPTQVAKVITKLTTLNKIAAATHTVEGEAQVRIAFAANGESLFRLYHKLLWHRTRSPEQ
jgi:hypothetical protein